MSLVTYHVIVLICVVFLYVTYIYIYICIYIYIHVYMYMCYRLPLAAWIMLCSKLVLLICWLNGCIISYLCFFIRLIMCVQHVMSKEQHLLWMPLAAWIIYCVSACFVH